jgi:3-oxoacyl-(acyl-carrier-protein) synthase
MDRIVVTGVGAVTPLGLAARETWEDPPGGRRHDRVDRSAVAFGVDTNAERA